MKKGWFMDHIDFDFVYSFNQDEENRTQQNKLCMKEGERREVAILFADIKNSTAMGSQLDPELFHQRLNDLMKRFTRCITYYGGYVDKYMGDGIMALFGAKKATEQDTERAILAALRMISQTEHYNKSLQDKGKAEDQIGIRIGINAGLVLVGKVGEAREGDFTVTGAAVNLAQRMEANAPVGKILLPLHTKQAVERFFEFTPLGMVSAKGFPEPIEAWTVLKPKLDKDARWYKRQAMYVGRTAELELLNRAYRHLEKKLQGIDDQTDELSIIGITGDAGLGKSRLVYEFTSALGNRAELLMAAASGIVKTPFNLFVNLLEHEFQLLPGAGSQARQQQLEAALSSLTGSLPAAKAEELWNCLPLIGALLEIPYQDPRLKLSGADLLLHLRIALKLLISSIIMRKLVSNKPLILILDDLHWMDEASAQVLPEILGTLRLVQGQVIDDTSLPVMVIMQYRQDYQMPEEISRQSHFRQVELKPLSDPEVLRLLRHHTEGKQVPQTTLDKVKQLSLGNPFYLEEWCNYLNELEHKDLFDLPVPNNLHALILSRLDLLDDAIRLLLQKASVIGHEFLVEILRWMEQKLYNPGDLEDTLSALEQQSFILKLLGFDYSAYFFKHIVTRDVAYQTLLLENRTILHKLAAEAIEELYPDRQQEFLYKLADHYHRAEVGDKAVFYLEQAALAAKKVYSNNLAIELFEKLLGWVKASWKPGRLESGKVEKWKSGTDADSSNHDPEKGSIPQHSDNLSLSPARILLYLAEIKWLIGKWDESDLNLQEALTFATQSQDTEELFDCHRLKGISSFQRGNFEQAKAEWDTCLELASSRPPDPSTSRPLDPLTSRPPDFSTSRLLAIVNGNLGIWFQHHKLYDEAITHHQQSLEYANAIQDELRKARTFSNLGLIYMNQKDYTKAEDHFQACLELAEANHYLKEQSIALGNLGFLAYKQGDLDKAMPFYEKKWLLVDKMDDKGELIKVLGNIANIHRDKGQHREALEYYQKVLAQKLHLGNPKELAITYYCIAEEHISMGDISEAIEYLQIAASYLPPTEPLLQTCLKRLSEIDQ